MRKREILRIWRQVVHETGHTKYTDCKWQQIYEEFMKSMHDRSHPIITIQSVEHLVAELEQSIESAAGQNLSGDDEPLSELKKRLQTAIKSETETAPRRSMRRCEVSYNNNYDKAKELKTNVINKQLKLKSELPPLQLQSELNNQQQQQNNDEPLMLLKQRKQPQEPKKPARKMMVTKKERMKKKHTKTVALKETINKKKSTRQMMIIDDINNIAATQETLIPNKRTKSNQTTSKPPRKRQKKSSKAIKAPCTAHMPPTAIDLTTCNVASPSPAATAEDNDVDVEDLSCQTVRQLESEETVVKEADHEHILSNEAFSQLLADDHNTHIDVVSADNDVAEDDDIVVDVDTIDDEDEFLKYLERLSDKTGSEIDRDLANSSQYLDNLADKTPSELDAILHDDDMIPSTTVDLESPDQLPPNDLYSIMGTPSANSRMDHKVLLQHDQSMTNNQMDQTLLEAELELTTQSTENMGLQDNLHSTMERTNLIISEMIHQSDLNLTTESTLESIAHNNHVEAELQLTMQATENVQSTMERTDALSQNELTLSMETASVNYDHNFTDNITLAQQEIIKDNLKTHLELVEKTPLEQESLLQEDLNFEIDLDDALSVATSWDGDIDMEVNSAAQQQMANNITHCEQKAIAAASNTFDASLVAAPALVVAASVVADPVVGALPLGSANASLSSLRSFRIPKQTQKVETTDQQQEPLVNEQQQLEQPQRKEPLLSDCKEQPKENNAKQQQQRDFNGNQQQPQQFNGQQQRHTNHQLQQQQRDFNGNQQQFNNQQHQLNNQQHQRFLNSNHKRQQLLNNQQQQQPYINENQQQEPQQFNGHGQQLNSQQQRLLNGRQEQQRESLMNGHQRQQQQLPKRNNIQQLLNGNRLQSTNQQQPPVYGQQPAMPTFAILSNAVPIFAPPYQRSETTAAASSSIPNIYRGMGRNSVTFGIKCSKYLDGSCPNLGSKCNHQLGEIGDVKRRLDAMSTPQLIASYNFMLRHRILFEKYFVLFATIFGSRRMPNYQLKMLNDCCLYMDISAPLVVEIYELLLRYEMSTQVAVSHLMKYLWQPNALLQYPEMIKQLLNILSTADWYNYMPQLEELFDSHEFPIPLEFGNRIAQFAVVQQDQVLQNNVCKLVFFAPIERSYSTAMSVSSILYSGCNGQPHQQLQALLLAVQLYQQQQQNLQLQLQQQQFQQQVPQHHRLHQQQPQQYPQLLQQQPQQQLQQQQQSQQMQPLLQLRQQQQPQQMLPKQQQQLQQVQQQQLLLPHQQQPDPQQQLLQQFRQEQQHPQLQHNLYQQHLQQQLQPILVQQQRQFARQQPYLQQSLTLDQLDQQ